MKEGDKMINKLKVFLFSPKNIGFHSRESIFKSILLLLLVALITQFLIVLSVLLTAFDISFVVINPPY